MLANRLIKYVELNLGAVHASDYRSLYIVPRGCLVSSTKQESEKDVTTVETARRKNSIVHAASLEKEKRGNLWNQGTIPIA